ncbi:XdhC family protein (plasmid) [Sinorhizobium sp. B11]
MNEMLTTIPTPTPRRAILSDNPVDILNFALEAYRHGPVALATLVDIRGGAARALGSHVVIAGDGRFCGYVSGGCVEAAVASEALRAMATGRDRVILFGQGSPFYDIVLPCGGGITIAVHVLRDDAALRHVIENLARRRSAALRYDPDRQILAFADASSKPGWGGEGFVSLYRPVTRVVISGQNIEEIRLKDLAKASGYEVVDADQVECGEVVVDAFTAVVLLHHDLDDERAIVDASLQSAAFYIGALGSARTHRRRVAGLRERGWDNADTDRIKAPIGCFGPTRDATSLALSILADIAARRLAAYR